MTLKRILAIIVLLPIVIAFIVLIVMAGIAAFNFTKTTAFFDVIKNMFWIVVMTSIGFVYLALVDWALNQFGKEK